MKEYCPYRALVSNSAAFKRPYKKHIKNMVLKPYVLRGFKTLFFHRKTELLGQKPYEKIAFSALQAGCNFTLAPLPLAWSA